MKGFTRLSTIVFAIVLIFSAQIALAQNEKGSVTGHISDPSGGILQGAQISLQPGGIAVASNQQGGYFINNLAPGSYTIAVNYLGFATFTMTVDIKAGQTTTADVKMGVASQSQQILVTAEGVSGEAAAINREKTADNVLQVMSSEVIMSLPNANIADAVGRLPSVTLERDEGEGKYIQVRSLEPRLTNATIDGVNVPSPEPGVREIKFDAMPADLVESVEVNKTLQANMDGDGIGGSVNIVTKTASERPTIDVFGSGGTTPIMGNRNLVETGGTIGNRFGEDKRWGVLVGGSYDWNGRGINDIEPVPDVATFPDGSATRYFDTQDIREYQYKRSRWGLTGSADYKLGEGSDIYVRGIYSSFRDFGDKWAYTLTDNTPLYNPPQYPNGIQLLNSNGCSIDSTGNETCGAGSRITASLIVCPSSISAACSLAASMFWPPLGFPGMFRYPAPSKFTQEVTTASISPQTPLTTASIPTAVPASSVQPLPRGNTFHSGRPFALRKLIHRPTTTWKTSTRRSESRRS